MYNFIDNFDCNMYNVITIINTSKMLQNLHSKLL